MLVGPLDEFLVVISLTYAISIVGYYFEMKYLQVLMLFLYFLNASLDIYWHLDKRLSRKVKVQIFAGQLGFLAIWVVPLLIALCL